MGGELSISFHTSSAKIDDTSRNTTLRSQRIWEDRKYRFFVAFVHFKFFGGTFCGTTNTPVLNFWSCFALGFRARVELTGAISVVDAFGVEEGEAGSLSHGRLEQGVLRS